MKNKIIRLLSKTAIYSVAVKLIATRIIWSNELLTPNYLEGKGWVKEGKYYVEPMVKGRDKVWVHFEEHYYRVFHGENKTFISLQSRKEWFDNYYLLVCDNDRRYELAGV